MAAFKKGKWNPLDAKDLKRPKGEDEEENDAEDPFEDVLFGLEELDGEYEIINNQLVIKQSSKPKEEVALTKEKGKKKPKSETKAHSNGDGRGVEEKAPIVDDTQPETEEDIADLPDWASLDLHPYLLKGLNSLGFHSPTPIQRLCIPAVLVQGKDVLGAAETGSGKTLAYALPILSFLLNNPVDKQAGLPVLIVTPTRELALQVTEHLRKVLSETPLSLRPRIEPIVGGMAEVKQERLLSHNPEIIVATMGRLQAWISRHDHLANLRDSLRFLVVDEADRMADKAHFSDILPLIDILKGGSVEGSSERGKPTKKRQTLLFSATLLNVEDSVETKKSSKTFRKAKPTGSLALMEMLGLRGKPLICNISTNAKNGEAVEILQTVPTRAQDAKTGKTKDSKAKGEGMQDKIPEKVEMDVKLPDSISFFKIDCTDDDKEAFLHWIMSTSPQGSALLVFVNTINATKRLATTIGLSFPNWSISSLHANMEQKQRLRNLDRFREKSAGKQGRVLIASDVAARGLDIPDVDVVIHFGIPPRLDTFIHRSGRCGRAGRSGTVVALVSGFENRSMGKIRSMIAPKALDPYPTREVELKRIFARVRVCKQLARLQEELTNGQKDQAWKRRTAKEADLELDSDYEEGDEDDTKATIGRTLARKEHNQRLEQMQYEVARLKRELAYLLSGRADAASHGGEHRQGRKRQKR